MMFERKSSVEGYTEKGWMRVKFKWVLRMYIEGCIRDWWGSKLKKDVSHLRG